MRARLPVVETAEPTADVLARTDPEHEERERLGAALRAARAERGLSLRDVAEAAEISASMVSQLEAGKTSPSLSTLRRLAAALGRPVAAFFVEPDGQASPAPPARHATSSGGTSASTCTCRRPGSSTSCSPRTSRAGSSSCGRSSATANPRSASAPIRARRRSSS